MRIVYLGLNGMLDLVVGSFHFSDAPWMCDGGVVDTDELVIAEVIGVRSGELEAKVGDGANENPKSVRDFHHELHRDLG